MGASANRRRPRLVDRQFQLGLAWRMMLVFFLFFLLGIIVAFAPSVYVLATGSDLSVVDPAAREFLVLHKRVWPAALLVFGGVFLYTLVWSHRLAGPIHRINSVLREILEGRFPEAVALRRKDYLRPTADLVEALSKKLARDAGEKAGTRVPDGPGNAPE